MIIDCVKPPARNLGKLINDIAPAKTEWEKYYATMEYERIVWHDLWSYCRYIEVDNE